MRLLHILYSTLCLLIIVGSNTFAHTNNLKPKRPKNIIFLVGDGMGMAQVYAGYVKNQGKLNLEKMKYLGFSVTYSSDNLITDSAAGATAFSIGEKTYNGAIGVSADTAVRETILETAHKHGLSTGLVATCVITHATPASFGAHQKSRELYENIAMDLSHCGADVLIGGGLDHFNNRKDSLNLVDTLTKNGYDMIYRLDELKRYRGDKLAAFLYPLHPPKMSEGRGDMLSASAETAVEVLSKNKKGFFVMIEGSQIDWGGHANETEYIATEMVDFDNMIGKMIDFANKDKHTLIVVTADHECGGFAITGGSIADGTVEGQFIYTHHTGVPVPVFAYGPGAQEFMGIYQNTDIYHKMMYLLGIKKKDRT